MNVWGKKSKGDRAYIISISEPVIAEQLLRWGQSYPTTLTLH